MTRRCLPDSVLRLRRRGGQWFRQRRVEAGLTQHALARELGMDYNQFVSQIETDGKTPPLARSIEMARALNMKPCAYARQVLKYWYPELYAALFKAD